jgi:MFS family permease
LMTAMGGVAVNFGQFFLSRMGVGIGEAALGPSAYSMITDYFPKKKLATALSVYSMGIYIGSGIAILIGGVLAQLSKDPGMINLPIVGDVFPWQSIFFLIGIPGFIIVLLLLTIKEPARTGLVEGQDKASFKEVMAYIKANSGAFVLHSLGTGLIAMVTYSASSWVPTFLERVYDWTPQKVGIWFGSSIALFSTLGIIVGGRYADHLTKKGFVDADLRTARLAAIMLLGFGCFLPWFHSGEATFWIIIPMNFFGAFPFGATVAAIQKLMPGRMRSLGSAVYLFILNMVGIGIGPTLTGAITQHVFKDDKMVGYSLMVVTIMATLAAITCFSRALKPYRQGIENLKNLTA